jgi:hypothetical protein
MSSATSTDGVRLKPDKTGQTRGKPDAKSDQQADSGLEPWQFFVLAALGCATAALFASRGQGLIAVVLLTVLMAATALVGLAALRMLRPLVSPSDDRTSMIGHRTRAALEREKMLALRAIKELEFDRAMGKVSEADWREMSGRLRARATRLMRQLDAGRGYREQIEHDVAQRLGHLSSGRKDGAAADARNQASDVIDHESPTETGMMAQPTCAKCATANDADARFCKECGQKL